MSDKKEHILLFTGGLDSTYRLCQLSRDNNAIVKPVYVVDSERFPCLNDELIAQENVITMVQSNPDTTAKIYPLQRISREMIPYDAYIASFEKSLSDVNLGWQFVFLAMFAKYNCGCELCQEILWDFLDDKDVVFKEEDGKKFMLTDNLDDMCKTIFSNFSFPVMNVTREKMIKDLTSWGYKNIWKKVWFCYWGIDGKACGICTNCRKKINDGLAFLFSPDAIKRYLVYRYVYNFHYKVSLMYLDDYCHWHGDISKSPYARQFDNGLVVLRDDCFAQFKKLFECSNRKLKSLIINGSEKYGMRKVVLKNIDKIRNNEERRRNYEKLFLTIKD